MAQETERVLERLLAGALEPGEIARPDRLMEAMRHAALNGGKRLRPFLVIESAALFGASGAGVIRAACALELVHCYSLVHDDLPAMDDDDLRRGKPTVHKAFDDATAILAGDALQTLAFAVLAAPKTHADGAVRAELVLALAAAAGPGGMAGGQMLDLEAEKADAPLGEAAIRQLQAMKTGALIRFACEAGAIIGGASASDRAALADFGARLGFLFQIADDILDATSDAATLGKATGKDAGRNKATLVSLLGLDGARALRDREEAAAARALAPFGERADVLQQALRFASARKN
ncbi:MAG: polyprenyl synthetase family protein [Beijerinckiaceae bacterium]